jgi:hypothetical protein
VRLVTILLACAIVGTAGATACAQFGQSDQKGAELGQTRIQRWRGGVTVEAVGGPCQGIVATIPVPVDWPEQTVVISEEDVTSQARVNQRVQQKAVPQLVVNIRSLPTGQEARAVLTYEVTRRIQSPPANPEIYKIAEEREIPRDVKTYLAWSPPHIDSRDRRIRQLGGTLGADADSDWKRVEAIFDYVRGKIQFTKGKMKGAIKALEDGSGNHEDLCFAFIAICRAAGIPARTVWVPNHCYPEFYLVDDEGKGHWFPCQVAGPREFGGISEYRPIFQKGDFFRDPRDRNKTYPLLPETLEGAGGRPKVKFIRETLPN